jgi:prepilin-type N-terminal cleavage/methylation domain-containing protein
MRRRRAFTLVELLVVVGIISVLIAILLPVLGRARDQANRIKCMSNVRNIMQGIVMYASQNKSSLPCPNWGGNPAGSPGWLYDNPGWAGWTMEPDGPAWSYLEGGAVYRMISSREVFKCPLHVDRVSDGPTEKFTSYLMNGATSDFTTDKPHRVTKFNSMDIILWESGESSVANKVLGIPPFNDGSSQAREWISERHGGGGRDASGKVRGNGGASVGCIDGHVEWLSYKDYETEVQKPILKPGKSRLWIAPNLPNGGY